MKIKELLSDKSKWIQNCLAKNEKGQPLLYAGKFYLLDKYTLDNNNICKVEKSIPSSFCLNGAIYFCYPEKEERRNIFDKVIGYLEENYGEPFPPNWNDRKDRRFEDIRKLVEELDI